MGLFMCYYVRVKRWEMTLCCSQGIRSLYKLPLYSPDNTTTPSNVRAVNIKEREEHYKE